MVYFAWAIPVVFWLRRNNLELLVKRMDWHNIPKFSWDRGVFIIGGLLWVAVFLIPGLDAVRYEWSDVPTGLRVIGFAGLVPSLWLMFLAMSVNKYASRVVEIQEGHQIITTGAYKYIRHPMYTSIIVMFFSIPLMLGSCYALIPSVLLALLGIIRTRLEDRILGRELDGYLE